MSVLPRFSDAVEAAVQLSPEEQEELVEIVRRRLADRRRVPLAAEVAEARAEYGRGEARIVSAEDLFTEIVE